MYRNGLRVKNACEKLYRIEPTLGILTKQYNLFVFQHCFPVSNIRKDINQPDMNSSAEESRTTNSSMVRWNRKCKNLKIPNFLSGLTLPQVENNTTWEHPQRAKAFFDWVQNEWDSPNGNILLWDFYELETEDVLSLKYEIYKRSK